MHWLVDWAGPQALEIGTIEKEESDLVKQLLNRQKEKLNMVQINAHVWDAAERNLMIENKQFCGLVDQDELFMGDKWMAQALRSRHYLF